MDSACDVLTQLMLKVIRKFDIKRTFSLCNGVLRLTY